MTNSSADRQRRLTLVTVFEATRAFGRMPNLAPELLFMDQLQRSTTSCPVQILNLGRRKLRKEGVVQKSLES